MSYSDKIMDHYEHPLNMGSMDNQDPHVGTGMVQDPVHADVMRIQIQVNDMGVIEDTKFKTMGCGAAIAVSSLLTEWVKGKTLDEAGAIKHTEIAEALALPPEKRYCAVLAEDSIKAAVEDFKTKTEQGD